MNRLIFFLLFSFIASQTVSAQEDNSKDKESILSILDQQTKKWNDGDIEGFMKGYWENDSLMYIGKSGITYGFQNTLKNYKKNYASKALMGTLNFEIIEIKFPSDKVGFVVGKWFLKRPETGDIGGHFSLLWKKKKGKWVIIADHSS